MQKLSKNPLFYFFSIPISFLAGYGYANVLRLINQRKMLGINNDYDI